MPNFIDKLLESLFPKAPMPSTQPLVASPLHRKEQEHRQYFAWIQTHEARIFLQEIYESYEARKAGQEGSWPVYLLQTPYANGFALHYDARMPDDRLRHFFDWLKDRVMTLPYKLANTEHNMYDKGKYVEETERYYLKPRIKQITMDTPMDQQYGNIQIEWVRIDGHPSHLKFVASIYSDRLYTTAKPFEELLQHMFGGVK
jgi:hypothetical protein